MFMLIAALLVPSLTLDVGWHVDALCPETLTILAPATLAVGEEGTIQFESDSSEIQYAMSTADGRSIRSLRKAYAHETFVPSGLHSRKEVIITAMATRRGCPPFYANASIQVGQRTNEQSPLPIMPWLIAGIAVLIAAVLIWRR